MNEPDNNPIRISNEALLRFLDQAPSRATRTPYSKDRLSPECPAASDYMRVVMGRTSDEETDNLLEHASNCDACGEVLAASVEALEGNPSAEETAAIAELAAGSNSWRDTLAAKLAASKAQRRPVATLPGASSISHGRPWLTAAAAAAVLAAALGLIVWQRHANAPEHLLAMAYQQSRTLELRIPDAGYTAVVASSHTRGAGTGDEPAPLLDARASLARRLELSPQNAHWLELQARADVLEERYDSAIDVLNRLLAAGPVTAELLTDAASAYYQRGLVAGSELDRSTALDYLRRADELAPADPVVLFNEAIVMEDRGQMMNAVEVWNRYVTVERDPKWAAEGKRKLAALEQTLNRLKSHESRIRQMLATPEAMDALARNPAKLAGLDEELSSIQVDQVLLKAYPAPCAPASGGAGQARGSPCMPLCLAARRLLQATAKSLEIQHHDFWLSDLLSFPFDSLSPTAQMQYAQAMRLLGQATRENQTGDASAGTRMSSQSRDIFEQLKKGAGSDASLRTAAEAGIDRATVEQFFGISQYLDFRTCRAYAQQLHAQPRQEERRYPWIRAVWLITEKVCDDTPETRVAGRRMLQVAKQLAATTRYQLLSARIEAREADTAQNAGDAETTERITLEIFQGLIKGDPPPVRMAYTFSSIPYVEQDTPRAHVNELSLRETVAWFDMDGDLLRKLSARMSLVEAEMRIGATAEAEKQLRQAHAEASSLPLKVARGSFTEGETAMAQIMLERGDLTQAARFLDQATADKGVDFDTWELQRYNATLGQLKLARGDYAEAARTLEAEIQSSEGKDVRGGDPAMQAEYAQQDHDLYAELAAAWLGQGRPAIQVLALWERFRMRSRGLPIMACAGHALDCEKTSLLTEQQRLGDSVLAGQILLMDRVLVYRMDSHGIIWNEKSHRRQEVLDAAQTLENAVSSRYTSAATVIQLGAHLNDSLMPRIPASLGSDAALLLEPDPMLQNLPWPVLPTDAGPLGLRYPVADMPSILENRATVAENQTRSAPSGEEHALIVGASAGVEGEPPLPEAVVEARAVNGFLHAPELLLGERATAGQVAQKIETATLFHFAGHALQGQDGTELLLAPASAGDQKPWVDGAFLRQHPPRLCRLAVLSACSTGQREASWDHPLQDIVETFSSLGVPEVVATRWQIDSEATVPFMNSVYQNLKQGRSVAWALTAARKIQSSNSLYGNPYYWGAYYVTGREKTRLTKEFYAGLQDKAQGKKKTSKSVQAMSRVDIIFAGPLLFVPGIQDGAVGNIEVFAPRNGHPIGAVFVPDVFFSDAELDDPHCERWPGPESFTLLDSHSYLIPLTQRRSKNNPPFKVGDIPKTNFKVCPGRRLSGDWDVSVAVHGRISRWSSHRLITVPKGMFLGGDAPTAPVIAAMHRLTYTDVSSADFWGASKEAREYLHANTARGGSLIVIGEIPYQPTLLHERAAIEAIAKLAGLDLHLAETAPQPFRTHLMCHGKGCGCSIILADC